MQRNLSLAMAKTVAEAALAACQAKGYHTAVAVVDRAGQVLVILRDEQATAQHAEWLRTSVSSFRQSGHFPIGIVLSPNYERAVAAEPSENSFWIRRCRGSL